MGKFKYQGGITKMITSNIGKRNKIRFASYIEKNLQSQICKLVRETIQIDVVSFSSSNDFYEQVLSILSFLRYAGTPNSWTIYSDGSHTMQQTLLLKNCFEFISIEFEDWKNNKNIQRVSKERLFPYEDQLLDYAKRHPLGKKLFYYLNHQINEPTLFLDSDILFYDKAFYINLIAQEKVSGWYLPDNEWGCLDSRYVENKLKQLYQVNSGLFLCNQEIINLKEGLDFLKSLDFKYEYFSEQNIFHILFKSNSFIPLDPRIFVLNSEDQFDFSYVYPREKMALRHYTGPVRHKMWQKDWKWHLSLSLS